MAVPQNFRTALHGFNREDVVHYLEYLNAKNNTQLNQMNADAAALRQQIQKLQEELNCKASLVDQSRELEELKNQLESSKADRDQWETKCHDLEQRMEDLETAPGNEQELVALKAAVDQLNGEKAELKTRCSDLKQQLEDRSRLPVGPDPEELNRLHSMLDQSTAENAALRTQCADLRRELSQKDAAPAMQNEELEAYRRAERAERVATQRAEQIYQRVNLLLGNATTKVDGMSAEFTGAADRFNDQLSQLQATVAATKLALSDAVSTMYALRPEGSSEK